MQWQTAKRSRPSSIDRQADKPIRLIVADKQEVARRGIASVFENIGDVEIVAETGDVSGLLALIDDLHPDVVILDLEVLDPSSGDTVARLREISSSARVLLLSNMIEDEYLEQLVRGRVSGYLRKDDGLDLLLVAVRGISRGEKGWISPRLTVRLANAGDPVSLDQYGLTEREKEVVKLLSEARSNEEIASALHIAVGTLKNSLTKIYEKLGVKTRTEAVVWACRRQLT